MNTINVFVTDVVDSRTLKTASGTDILFPENPPQLTDAGKRVFAKLRSEVVFRWIKVDIEEASDQVIQARTFKVLAKVVGSKHPKIDLIEEMRDKVKEGKTSFKQDSFKPEQGKHIKELVDEGLLSAKVYFVEDKVEVELTSAELQEAKGRKVYVHQDGREIPFTAENFTSTFFPTLKFRNLVLGHTDEFSERESEYKTAVKQEAYREVALYLRLVAKQGPLKLREAAGALSEAIFQDAHKRGDLLTGEVKEGPPADAPTESAPRTEEAIQASFEEAKFEGSTASSEAKQRDRTRRFWGD